MDEKVRVQIDNIQTDEKFKYNGIIMPMNEGDDRNPYVIMSILPELAQPFDTKKRAPFKIVVETVKLGEIYEKNGK